MKTVKDIGEDKIRETSNIELLGIVIDTQLKFDSISLNCVRTPAMSVLTRMVNYTDPQ